MLAPLSAGAQSTLRVYHIGNSLTGGLTLDRVHALFAERGIDHQYGSQLSGGKTLSWHWNYREHLATQKIANPETNVPEGGRWLPGKTHADPLPKRFGNYDEALARHPWDAVVMQTYRGTLDEDVEAISRFIRFALDRRTASRFLVYTTWPRRAPATDQQGQRTVPPINYAAAWELPWPPAEGAKGEALFRHSATRAYFQQLLQRLGAAFPNLPEPVREIPVGEVLFALDAKIREGRLPSLADLHARKPALLPGFAAGPSAGANILYADPIHLNPVPHSAATVGACAAGLTAFSVLARQSPVGLSGKPYELDDPRDQPLLRALQETVWEVVSQRPDTGLRR
jgi:hypothetical protein